MKKLFFIISAICISLMHIQAQQVQYLPVRTVLKMPATGQGSWGSVNLNNFEFCGLQYIPTSWTTKKCPIIIFLHGIGECGGRAGVPWDTTANSDDGPDALYTTTPMSLVKTSSGQLVNRKFTKPGTDEEFEFAFWAIQLWGVDGLPNGAFGFTTWPPPIIDRVITHIKTNLADKIDTNRIYLSGLSYGGGGSNTMINSLIVNPKIAAAAFNCTGFRYGENVAMLAQSALPVWICHADGDNQANVSISDAIVNNLRNANPVFPVKYWRLDQDTHFIWDWMYTPSQWSNTRLLQNGAVVNYGNPNVYEWFLQFDTSPSGRIPVVTQTP